MNSRLSDFSPSLFFLLLLAFSCALAVCVSDTMAASTSSPILFQWSGRAPADPAMPWLCGHTDTLPDIVGRIEPDADLTIFTEGNHFMVVVPAALENFRDWCRTRPEYASLNLENIVLVTLPQPMIVSAILSGGLGLGGAVVPVVPGRGIYPDIVMGGPDPLRKLRAAGKVLATANVFAKNLGLAILVRVGNPLGISGLVDLSRKDCRTILATPGEPGARNGYLNAVRELAGAEAVEGLLKKEVAAFPGRLGIQHRDVPFALAQNLADAGIIFRHLAEYYQRTFPDIFEAVPVDGAERFGGVIAATLTPEGANRRAAKAFLEFYQAKGQELYPPAGFARLEHPEFWRALDLDAPQ